MSMHTLMGVELENKKQVAENIQDLEVRTTE